jgi:short-subunit dehydrogenase
MTPATTAATTPATRPGTATALVTGATAGIGNAFARALASRGTNLVLVARDAPRLAGVAQELRDQHGVEVEVIAADLADREQLERVAERLRDRVRPVDLLVNNAGFAVKQYVVGGDVRAEEQLLDVLVRAVLVLSSAAAPGMVERRRGALVTVSSVASFLPSGTYSAAKAWATTFTLSLAAELAGTGVTATALCPGYVRTEFHRRAGIRMGRLPSRAWMDADEVVATCLRDVASGRSLSVPGLRYRLAVVAGRHAPLRLLQWFSTGRMRRRYR